MAILLIVLYVNRITGIPLYNFMADPSTIVNMHPTYGIISNLGILILCACASICFFGWRILSQRSSTKGIPRFLLFAGYYTMILLLDDLFLGHEMLNRYVGHTEVNIYIMYVILLLLLLIVNRKQIFTSDYILLLLSLGFLGLSISVDIFEPIVEQYVGKLRILFEDGFKLLGYVSWFGYYALYSYSEILKSTSGINES
ncbi:MAG: hypothetical protein ACXAD7_27305 [Candidatus Kariarchaeaceae archaeon]